MRTRIRSHAQHLTGRRRHVARRPPDEELVLHLQHTIGNRATTQLLQREPTLEEDVAAERARFDARKAEHVKALAGYAERMKPHALKTAGITTDSRVNDKSPMWIQAALAESQKLRPYLSRKFPASAVTKDFVIDAVEDDFNTAAKSMMGNTQPMTKDQRAAAYGKIGGFFDRRTRTIHVRSRSKFGHAVHEAMHKVAHPGFHGFWGDFINEGVTQLMADCLLQEQGLSIVTDHQYGKQLECAKKLVAATSFDTVARAYFLFDSGLRERLMSRFHMDLGTFRRELMADNICPRL